jgi:ParB-like chromosome segregation protein Spo0J
MAMEIVHRDLSSLIPYANNPRVNDHAVDQMIAVIEEFGFKIPMLARSNGEIVDGHLRFKAATKMGLPEVPVILVDDWSEAQIKAARLVINKSVSWAEWDNHKLKDEFAALQALDFDLNFTGFNQSERDLIMKGWESDHEGLSKIKENEDGIPVKITLTVPQAMKQEIKDWLEGMIEDSEYVHDIKLS